MTVPLILTLIKDKDPEWNDTFRFYPTTKHQTLQVRVYDKSTTFNPRVRVHTSLLLSPRALELTKPQDLGVMSDLDPNPNLTLTILFS